jgi:hypothetical protein
MQQFMKTFVGNGFHLQIKERESTFQVHTIEIMQKTDATCPITEISVGDYFLHLIATDSRGNEASLSCNWTEELLQNLLNAFNEARDAGFSQITLCRDPICNGNNWLFMWGDNSSEGQIEKPSPITCAG